MASARVVALRCLKVRPRSVEEIREKLKAKEFSQEEITATIEYLFELRLLDDRAFTRSWIQYRLARPFGFRRIYLELKDKGVAKEIIEEAIAQVKEEYGEEDTVLELAERRWKRLDGVDPQKRKKRVFDFLIRRGFSVDAVMKVFKKLK
jgi:regulatory protein